MTADSMNEIGALFHEALALDREDRAAFLESRCAAVPSLRADWMRFGGLSEGGAEEPNLEAEPYLLEGYRGLRDSLGLEHAYTRQVLDELIDFYENQDQPEKAAEYRTLRRSS